MIDRHALPRYPPRKTRESNRLINFMIRWMSRLRPFNVLIPAKSPYSPGGFHELLILAGVSRSSLSRKSREVRERSPVIPSGETVLRWLKRLSINDLAVYQQDRFQAFLDMLPAPFQHVRRKGMILTVDFHLDPDYSKQITEYIVKAKQKASTKQFFSYLTVLWTNAPEPVTLGVIPVPRGWSLFELVRVSLEHWLTAENVVMVLADGEFYNRDFVHFLKAKNVQFIIRGHNNRTVKKLFEKHEKELAKP